MSLYKEIFIDQTQGGADIYESGEGDDDFAHATPVVIDSPVPQHHNFYDEYDEEDVDWIKFYGRASVSYTIKISNQKGNCKAEIKLYDENNKSLPISDDDGTKEWVFKCKKDKDGFYYIKISNENGECGENTAYDIEILSNKAGVGWLKGYVTDTCHKSIKGAEVQIDGGRFTTDARGLYSIQLPDKKYSVTVEAAGYNYQEKTADIKASGESEEESNYLDFELEPQFPLYHSADSNEDYQISSDELNRAIQDSKTDFSELLMLIQFHNTISGYQVDCNKEYGFKVKEQPWTK